MTHYANLFAGIEAKTGIKQSDWLAKKFVFLLTNHVAEFLCSLKVARTNSPSGKPSLEMYASDGKLIRIRGIRFNA